MDKMWECKKCGACCRWEGVEIALPDYWDGEKCKYLTNDHLCAIYENRPESCRVPSEMDSKTEALQVAFCSLLNKVEVLEDIMKLLNDGRI